MRLVRISARIATSASTVIAGGRLACASTATRRARSFALSDRVATPSMRTPPHLRAQQAVDDEFDHRGLPAAVRADDARHRAAGKRGAQRFLASMKLDGRPLPSRGPRGERHVAHLDGQRAVVLFERVGANQGNPPVLQDEVDEERPAEKRHEDAHRHLVGREQHARQQVGHDDERRARHGGQRQRDAVVVPDEKEPHGAG